MTSTVVYYLHQPDGRGLARVVMFDNGALAVQFVDPDDRRRPLEEHRIAPTSRGGEEDLLTALVELGIVREPDVAALRRAWRPGVDPGALSDGIADLFWLICSLHRAADEVRRDSL